MTDTPRTPPRAPRARGAKAAAPAETPSVTPVVVDAEVILDVQGDVPSDVPSGTPVTPRAKAARSASAKATTGKPARPRRSAPGDEDEPSPVSRVSAEDDEETSDGTEGADEEDLDIDFDGASDDAIDVDMLHGEAAPHGAEAHDDGESPRQALPVLRPSTPGASTRDSLHLYLREISRFPLLKPDEEFDLARRVQEQGDSDAAFRLVTSHLRLVVKIAMDFQRRWMQNVLDLIQEGNVGLMRAVNKFDPEKGIKFSYYAAFWIKAYILKFIMDNWRMVKIGTTQAQRKLFYNLNKERQRLIAQGYDPDAATLSEKLNVTVEQVVEMEQRLDSSDMSLDITVGEDSGGATRMDFLPALGPGIEETLANSEIARMVQDRVQTILPKLSDKEAYILQHRLLSEQPVTLREIGEKYDITRERVRQIEARLLQKLRDHLFKEIRDFSSDWISQ
ncbi:RNA polymerase sigma factor, sigma-70 family protein [Desulfovibrio sp. A2]|nr:RNA polymerase sigma factor, sigma-70 family protein [Desulfovibrio sp. A2]